MTTLKLAQNPRAALADMARRSTLFALALAAAGLAPAAAGAEPVQMVVPYQGNLDIDGVPVDGEVQMTFTLFDTAEGPQGEGEPWRECHPQVRVHNGSFSVRLGAPVGPAAIPMDLTAALGRNRQHYLEIAVRRRDPVANPAGDCDDGGGAWTTFGTRQRISPVPQSMVSVLAVPTGAVMHFALPVCPAGWVEYEPARGRYVVGLQPGGALGGAVGSALAPFEDRPVGQHAHGVFDPGHGHGVNDPGHGHGIPTSGNDSWGPYNDTATGNWERTNSTTASVTGISIQGALTNIGIHATGVPGTPAPYLQLLTCIKD